MAHQAPAGFDTHRLRNLVRMTYEQVAARPTDRYHFHRGARYGIELLGYDPTEAMSVPSISADRFAGVGNPHCAGPIYAGETVLDHACGAGFDLLLAARRVGPRGRAIGVDMTEGMAACARLGAEQAGLSSVVDVRAGYFEALPIETGSVNVVMSNGVLNLSPDKPRVLAEIVRVLEPGGRLHLSDVVVRRELKPAVRSDPALWAACIAGALPEHDVTPLLLSAGFSYVRHVQSHDCFRGTHAADVVSKDLEVHGATFFAIK